MSRRIITVQYESKTPNARIDTYFDKVIKYIPADIVCAWVTANGLIESAANIPKSAVLWITFAIATILTAVWTLKQTSFPDRPLAITQITISTLAFIVWVFALGGPFATLGFYQPVYGSLLLIFYTLVVGLINPLEE